VASGERQRIPEQCEGPMNTLKNMIYSLPESHQLLTARRMPYEPFTYVMHTSYLKFSEKGNKFSRDKLLAAVREVMFVLHECKLIFTEALEDRDALRNENEVLYAVLLKNDEAWRELAEKQVALKMSAATLRNREEGKGLMRSKSVGSLRALLERLADLRG
jgi:hypothetical protein